MPCVETGRRLWNHDKYTVAGHLCFTAGKPHEYSLSTSGTHKVIFIFMRKSERMLLQPFMQQMNSNWLLVCFSKETTFPQLLWGEDDLFSQPGRERETSSEKPDDGQLHNTDAGLSYKAMEKSTRPSLPLFLSLSHTLSLFLLSLSLYNPPPPCLSLLPVSKGKV